MSIEEDKLSGAAVLTEKALVYLRRLTEREFLSREQFLRLIEEQCSKISDAHRSMVSLQNELFHVLDAAAEGKTLREALEHVRTTTTERIQFLKKAEETIIQHGASLIRKEATILTHSRSSTVEKILIHAYKEHPFYIIVTESRPNCEGRLLAESLAANGIEVIFIVDAAASLFSPDFVLVGADSVTPNYVINKIGTKLLAKCYPTYVACSTSKFTRRDVAIEEKDPNEVLGEKHKNIRVKNYYFDGTPLKYFRGFITEYGILTPEKVRIALS
jgi:translation initiation factor 2B subunit (eIF-2B alpha/beta/delta family)